MEESIWNRRIKEFDSANNHDVIKLYFTAHKTVSCIQVTMIKYTSCYDRVFTCFA